jgi:hypothetical protein
MLLRKLVDLVLNQIIQDVPKDIAVCEFDCRRIQCSRRMTCERRLNRARNELMPARDSLTLPRRWQRISA